MTENIPGGPSLIKLGKLANGKDFDQLEGLWAEALDCTQYTWRELIPIAGQVGRLKAMDRADSLMDTLVVWVEEKKGHATALEAVREAANQLPKGAALRKQLHRLYSNAHPDFAELPDLLDKFLTEDAVLQEAAELIDLYVQLQVGSFAMDLAYLVPGLVTDLAMPNAVLTIRFDDRNDSYGPSTMRKLTPRPDDFFPALLIYHPEQLRSLAEEDAVGFVKTALKTSRDGRLGYRELKGHIVKLMGEKGWKTWWQAAKRDLKRDPLIGMTGGSQPTIRLLRQADRFEDRLRREFDFCKDPQQKLLKVMSYLDEVLREEKRGDCEVCGDMDLLTHFGNGSAKIAVAALKTDPSLALAGLALHDEIAQRGAAVAKPNPKAAAAVLARIGDAGELVNALPESLLQRVMNYIRRSVPARWGEVWALVLLRSGKRLCDVITRGLIEGGQKEALAGALWTAMEKPSASADLMGWLWRNLHTSGQAAGYLADMEGITPVSVANSMFLLLDSTGKLYGLSMEEKHLIIMESARAAFSTQNNRPLMSLMEEANRAEAIRLKELITSNHGLAPSLRTQMLGMLRSRHADIFIDITREWEDGSVVYTTEGGLRLLQDALNTIVNDEIPEVAKQIGEAASHGDLSENAEFTAALEKRDQLASRATFLETELKISTVITAEMCTSDFVNVGTRVTARPTDSDTEEVFTFLGPWDTDVEAKILNYQAPLSMAFMGARVGDTVAFGEEGDMRSWEILAIAPAF